MYCINCGKEMKEGARFCAVCGAPAAPAGNAGAANAASAHITGAQAQVGSASGQDAAGSPAGVSTTFDAEQGPAAGQGQPAGVSSAVQPTTFAQQMESDKKRSRKKLPPFVLIALALALAAAAAFASYFIYTNVVAPEPEVQPVEAEQPATEAEEQQPEVPALPPEEQAIKDLDGWWDSQWHKPGYMPAFGHVHDGVIDWYRADTDASGASTVAYGSTVEITRAERFDENGTQGWRFFTNASNSDSWAYYQADGKPDELPIYMVSDGYGVITESNTDHPTRFGMKRIPDDFDWGMSLGTPEQFEQAQALAAERGNAVSESAEPAKDEAADQAKAAEEQAKREQEARDAAIAAGKQVFTGTVFVQDAATRMQETGRVGAWDTSTPGGNPTFAFLVLDAPMTVTARNGDGGTNKQEPFRTRDGIESVLLGSDDNQYSDFATWKAYEGQKITLAYTKEDMSFFSDSVGALFSVGASVGNPEFISPLSGNAGSGSTQPAAASSGDYVLADSNSRYYSRGELEAMDNETLFHARNEIYARHGRQFKNADLQSFFGSKSWYSGTVAPDSFSDDVLNDFERKNAELMRSIEEERNSPYLK